MIKKSGNKWVLYSKNGDKILGRYNSKKGAEKREKQVRYWKNINK